MTAFGAHRLDDLHTAYERDGFAILRGLWDDAALEAIEEACESVQRQLLAGALGERYGTSILVDDGGERSDRFTNYVQYTTELSPVIRDAVHHPTLTAVARRVLGPGCWLQESTRFGVVYQDARPGRESAYTRIGWHSDWQSGPNLDVWPSTAFTIHLDETSPANGFLRAVPGSHRWATPAPYRNINDAPVPEGSAPAGGHTDEPPPFPMPLGFEKVPGEVAVYCDRGDVIFHDAYLWHSAARATDDATKRRHLRGGWFCGNPLDPADEHLHDFVKNAAR